MEFFSFEEMEASVTASRKGIDNRMPEGAKRNVERLVNLVLDPARRAFGAPITVTSGYRCHALNRAVGGAARSYHLQGRAADVVTGSLAGNRRLFEILKGLPHVELIWECNGRWIHVAV